MVEFVKYYRLIMQDGDNFCLDFLSLGDVAEWLRDESLGNSYVIEVYLPIRYEEKE